MTSATDRVLTVVPDGDIRHKAEGSVDNEYRVFKAGKPGPALFRSAALELDFRDLAGLRLAICLPDRRGEVLGELGNA